MNIKLKPLLPVLDLLAIVAWGIVLLKYWATGQLKLLIHPNYFWLVWLSGMILLVIGGVKGWQWAKEMRALRVPSAVPLVDGPPSETIQHITLLPKGWSSGLLLLSAIAGLFFSPTILNAQVALQRGISESLPATQIQPQAFMATTKPEERTLIDWIRTLNAYPEPDAYAGQKANITGFVVHSPHLPNNYILVSRFIVTCCAVDAYPVGLPVKLESDRSSYQSDTWVEVTGEMLAEMLPIDTQTMQSTTSQKRQLVLAATAIKTIPTPDDPYGYRG